MKTWPTHTVAISHGLLNTQLGVTGAKKRAEVLYPSSATINLNHSRFIRSGLQP